MSRKITGKPESANQVEKRKVEHLKIQLTQNVEYQHKSTLLENVFLLHNALPEINRNQVNTETSFLKHKFKAPLMVAAITGGAKQAGEINKNIAKACQVLGLGMGFGSMKAMLVEPSLTYSYQVRDVAPDIFLAGNIGANDLKHFTPKILKEALKKIGANILAVHLNPAQELVQKEGDAQFENILKLINKYSKVLPIYVKEVGQGISGNVAKKLAKTNIQAIDTGGSGGTSWVGIEYLRRGMKNGPYWDWGIPTALSILQIRNETNLPLIATGGIRTGEDIVKCICLGANISALALPILHAGAKGYIETKSKLEQLIKETGDIMFLLGAKSVSELKIVKPIITGQLRALLN